MVLLLALQLPLVLQGVVLLLGTGRARTKLAAVLRYGSGDKDSATASFFLPPLLLKSASDFSPNTFRPRNTTKARNTKIN